MTMSVGLFSSHFVTIAKNKVLHIEDLGGQKAACRLSIKELGTPNKVIVDLAVVQLNTVVIHLEI